MDNKSYIIEKKINALDYIYNLLGKKDSYTFNDVFKLLSSYNFTKEISLLEINDYLPSTFKLVESIEEFSKGYITNNSIYKIYVVNYGSTFAIRVVSSLNGKYISNYYGDMFNDFTMGIYYSLEVMCK